MSNIVRSLCRDWADDCRGAAALEYSLLALMIAVVIVTALFGLGGNLGAALATVAQSL